MPETLARRKAPYRTRHVAVSVEISHREQTIDTLEGPVACQPGDAIVTGGMGERWPVPAAKFLEKYEPAQGQVAGASGSYTKRRKEVFAAQLHAPLTLQLSGGRGALSGKAADWCIWFAETDLAIVASDIFPKLYESDAVCVYVELGNDLSCEDKTSALLAVHALDVTLPHTTIVFTEEAPDKASEQPVWFRIVKKANVETQIIPSTTEISVASVAAHGTANLVDRVKQVMAAESVGAYSFRKFGKLFVKRSDQSKDDSLESIVAWQLAAVEFFNAHLKTQSGIPFPYPFIEKRDESTEPTGLKKICQIGAVADQLATRYQTKWQELVFATTREIADESMARRLLSVRLALVTLGLLAAVMMVSFSELSGKCELNDPWGFAFCAGESWEHLAGPGFFLVYLLALVVAWCRYAKAKTGQWEAHHQDFRLLAECLRVLHVRTLLGKPLCVASDLPLAEPTDSGWVQLALRSIFFDARQSGLETAGDDAGKVAQAIKSFVIPQVEYHEDTLLTRREKAIERLSGVARIGFGFFMVILAVLTLNVAAEFFHHAFLSPMMHHVALISLVVGLGSWGGMRKVIDTFGWEQELHRGRLVLSCLAQAQKAGRSDAILKAANYFLTDQAQWHALHRSRPIEAATGG